MGSPFSKKKPSGQLLSTVVKRSLLSNLFSSFLYDGVFLFRVCTLNAIHHF